MRDDLPDHWAQILRRENSQVNECRAVERGFRCLLAKNPDFTQNPILPRYSLTLLRPMYELREVETRYVRRMLPQTLAAPKNLAMADA
jgi:hypothetical protein